MQASVRKTNKLTTMVAGMLAIDSLMRNPTSRQICRYSLCLCEPEIGLMHLQPNLGRSNPQLTHSG